MISYIYDMIIFLRATLTISTQVSLLKKKKKSHSKIMRFYVQNKLEGSTRHFIFWKPWTILIRD